MSAMQLTINCEEDAWKILKEAVSDTLKFETFDFKFKNWPILDIKLKGDKFKSTLTPKVMESFIEIQKDVFRAYANLRYNSPNARLLTEQEKQSLEILVKVAEGSTEAKVDLQEALISFVKGAVSKMDGKQAVITIITLGLLLTSGVCYKGYLDHQIESQKIEMEKFSKEQETERYKIIKDIAASRPALQIIKDNAEDTYNVVLKGAATAQSLEIAGDVIPQQDIKQLIRKPRAAFKETRLDGACQILKVDSSRLGLFLVHVKYLADDRIFTAEVKEEFIATKDKFKGLINTALWGKRPVKLTMNCREKEGMVKEATILGVEEIVEVATTDN